jgi:hypothetical protein
MPSYTSPPSTHHPLPVIPNSQQETFPEDWLWMLRSSGDGELSLQPDRGKHSLVIFYEAELGKPLHSQREWIL